MAVLDTPISGPLAARCAGYLEVGAEGVWQAAVAVDTPTHGSAILDLLLNDCADARYYAIKVMDAVVEVGASGLLAALHRLQALDIDVVNISLGVRADRRALSAAVAQLTRRGVLICAAAPARGGPVYPAGYADVIAVSGDARCMADEHSHIGSGGVDFGASPTDAHGQPAGASFAVPRICARIARFLADGGEREQVLPALQATARYRGREQRRLGA